MELERLKLGEKQIILLGTAHISQRSADEVKEAIEKENPDVVGVELDVQRLKQLKQGKKWREMDIGRVIGSGQAYLFLLSLLLANMQRQLGQKIGMKPGAEMVRAIEIAEEKKIPIMLLDRDVNITLKRAMQKTSVFEKIKFLFSLAGGLFAADKAKITSGEIEKLKEKDVMNRLMEELSKEMPSVKSVLVDERDAYIAYSITHAPGKKILAVVGAGHIEGIKEQLGRNVDIREISRAEKKTGALKALGYAIPLVFIAIIAAIFLTKGLEVTGTALVYWVLANGFLSALGVLLARGHLFSVLAAFIAAPLTSLHPFLAAGWVAGYAEAKVKNPKVMDFENLRNLNSYADFSKNQVTRILMVVAFANIGSTIGTIVAFPLIASLLG